MNILLHRTFLTFTIALALITASTAQDTSHYKLSWQPIQYFPVNEDDYLELIYFEQAQYSDTLPALPVFSARYALDVPHFKYEYQLDDFEFEAVTAAEEKLLRTHAFSLEQIRLQQALQSSRKQRYSVVSFYPFVFDAPTDSYKKLSSFTLQRELVYDAAFSLKSDREFVDESVLATGSWYKLCVDETGIYRLTYNDLDALGVDVSALQKQHIRLFGNGGGMLPELSGAHAHDDLIENAIYVSGSATGAFGQDDYILFYGESPDRWHFDEAAGLYRYERHLYANKNCYFIATDLGPGKRIESQAEATDDHTHQVSAFRDKAVHQRELMNLLLSGQIWFGEVFDATLNRQFTFDFPNLDTSVPATVEAFLAARAPVLSTFTVSAGSRQKNMPIAPIDPAAYNRHYVRSVNDTLRFTSASDQGVTVNLAYNRPAAGSRGYLNYLVVNADRHLNFTGPQMPFRNVDHLGGGNILEYRLQGAGGQHSVWDVTDIFNIRRQETRQDGNSLLFRLPGDSLREFIAFDGLGFLEPELVGPLANQNLHALEATDIVMVVPDEFMEEAQRLADFRAERNGLSSTLVTPQQIYNEFSSGKPDAAAIRNFMKMFYDRAATPDDFPRYLLLFGNGTVDNKDRLGYGGNLIPTYQSLASFSPRDSYMTDDFFGLLADHEGEDAFGIPDVGIGRLPVRTPEEAAILVDKIIRYEKRVPGMAPGEDNIQFTGTVSNYADWRNIVVFIADDGDNNTHFDHAEILTNNVLTNHPEYNIEKIYLDAYQQVTMAGGARYPEVNRAINARVNQGALMINYIGHGGTRGLAHQRILTFDDIATWNNMYNMPVFMTATCEFSSFDQPDPEELSAGVRIVLKPEGGTPALYTTTRLAWSGTNLTLNRNFMEVAFARDEKGQYHRLGDLIRLAKQKSGGASTPMELRNFVLLGDPAMQMGYPTHRVVTESLPDTLSAFQKATVSGYITDAAGNKLHDYNGVIYPTVYDKKNTFRTLGNNAGSNPADFSMRNAVLYKGKASVVNGAFSFDFIVPKDIAYDFGEGKISYYVDDGYVDGHGYSMDFIIGGTMDTFSPDSQGPDIELFINDTTFVSGDFTNENPILLAHLFDDSGINITGSLGHDIVAYLNDDLSEPIRLNNYFQADLDTYQSGRVVYPFYRLEEGRYSLSLRAWDVHNNPSSASIDFVVAKPGELVLEDLVNYPNPFSHDTWFVFKHNQAFSEMDVRIDIFDLQGQLVNTINERVFPAGFQSTPIHWDGVSNDGRRLGNGVYLYRVTMTTPEGRRARQAEKLIIFRR